MMLLFDGMVAGIPDMLELGVFLALTLKPTNIRDLNKCISGSRDVVHGGKMPGFRFSGPCWPIFFPLR